MPTINPLLYSDTTENDVLAAPGAKPVGPPKVGLMTGYGAAVATTVKNSAAAVWATGKEAVERAVTGQAYDKLTERAPDLNMPKMEKINPLTTGAAAQILAPLTVDIPATILSLGAGAGIAGARERMTSYGELRDQGVDAQTARGVALEKGAETVGTFALTSIPFAGAIGKLSTPALRWGAKAAVGVGVQTGMDAIGGETRAQILDAHGYTKQAEQMRHWDAMRIASDVIGGSMLGLTTRATVSDAENSARWWIQGADNLQHESGPGIPTTPEASGVTTEATIKAVNDINAGQPVNVSEVAGIHDAEFLARNAADIKDAETYIKQHDTIVKNYDKQITGVQRDIEKARADGMHDIADHLENEELPRLQAIKQSSERLADQWRDDLERLKNPEAPTPAETLARPSLDAHAEDLTAIRQKAEEFRTPADNTTPAAIADKGETPKRDVVTEARQMVNDYRNPIQAATKAEPGAAAAPKLTPEQQELVNMHGELRALADATGDTDLHAELDAAMAAHQAAHAEANKFNIAALCAIGG